MLIEHGNKEKIEKHINDEKLIIAIYSKFDTACEMMQPILNEVAKEVNVLMLNIELNHDFATQNGVAGVPSYIFYKKGQEVGTRSGFMPKEILLAMVK